jgi:integrase
MRDVPIHPRLLQCLLGKIKERQSPFILAYEDGRRLDEKVLCGMNRKFRLKLDIPGFCFHVLRHTFVSRMAGAGADIFAISKIIGHSNTQITESTYTHLKDTYYQTNINKLKIAI